LQLDFLTSATQVERQIRAFSPQTWFSLGTERIRIVSAEILPPSPAAYAPATVIDDALGIACNPGAVRPILVQRAGKSVMTVAELLRGFPIPTGSILG
jgi:methionyl-tRNA formyltransferase